MKQVLSCFFILFFVVINGIVKGANPSPYWPLNGEGTSVMQDLRWNGPKGLQANPAIYELEVDMDRGILGWQHFFSYHELDAWGKLSNFGQYGVLVFDPWKFLDELSDDMPGKAPVFEPGKRYRFRVREPAGQYTDGQWSDYFTFTIPYKEEYKVGVDAHLTTPGDWQQILNWNIDQQEFIYDIPELKPTHIFEGMLMAWGRDAFRTDSPAPYEESDFFVVELYNLNETPVVIGNCMFMPYRVPASGPPVFGIDFFSMFDILGDDKTHLVDPTHGNWNLKNDNQFGRDDPKTRPAALYYVYEDSSGTGTPLTYNQLYAYYTAVGGKKESEDQQEDPYPGENFFYENVVVSVGGQTVDIQAVFGQYIRNTVNRYKPRDVKIWHFMNEPSGPWYIDPRLYARQLAFFASQVRLADPTAKVMMAALATTIAPTTQQWWLDHFKAELTRMKNAGLISALPFDIAGLNVFIERESDFHVKYTAYTQMRDMLEELSTLFNRETIPIIIKEHNSLEPKRTIAFLFELGAESVLWFHYFTGDYKLVTDPSDPCHSRTGLWYELQWINDPCELPVANAGPGQTIEPGQSVQIGTPAQVGCTYNWTPTTGLSNPHIAQPYASPASTTTYTVEVTNECGHDFDSVKVTVDEFNGSVTLITPNGGETWETGETYQIRWSSTGNPGPIRLELQSNGVWQRDIANNITTPGYYWWTIPETIRDGNAYKIKVRSEGNQLIYDFSDNYFTIEGCDITADAGPDQTIIFGNSVRIGTPAQPGCTYRWSPTTGLSNPNIAQPYASPAATTTYTVTASNYCGTASDSMRVNVQGSAGSITVISPNGGEVYQIGYNMLIQWNYTGDPGPVNIYLYNGYTSAEPIGSNLPNVGYYWWLIPINTPFGDQYRIKIRSAGNPNIYDYSNSFFTIGNCSVTADAGPDVSAAPGSSVRIGTLAQSGYTYRWSPTTALSNPNIAQPYASPTSTTTYTVTATNSCGSATDSVVVNVETTSTGTVTLTYPNGGEVLQKGQTYTIRWSSTGNPGLIRLELQNYGTWQSDIARYLPNTGSYQWTIPSHTQSGSNYKIKVRAEYNQLIFDFSNGNFTIQ